MTFANNDENSYHVVTAGNLDQTTTRLDGFIIQGGNANINNEARKIAYGGGLYNNNNTGSPSLANLIFYKNFALVGGGLYNVNADALIVNCRLDRQSRRFWRGRAQYRLQSNPGQCALRWQFMPNMSAAQSTIPMANPSS